MKFTVVWNPDAEADLTRLWLAARDRAAITEASDHIDTVLRDDARFHGEPLPGLQKVLVRQPLAVTFQVFVDDYTVKVLSVSRAQWD